MAMAMGNVCNERIRLKEESIELDESSEFREGKTDGGSLRAGPGGLRSSFCRGTWDHTSLFHVTSVALLIWGACAISLLVITQLLLLLC